MPQSFKNISPRLPYPVGGYQQAKIVAGLQQVVKLPITGPVSLGLALRRSSRLLDWRFQPKGDAEGSVACHVQVAHPGPMATGQNLQLGGRSIHAGVIVEKGIQPALGRIIILE